MNIAVLGTGSMGFPIARRLCEAGHAVHAWNRTRGKAAPLAGCGAVVHDTAASTLANAQTIVVMLENGAAVSDVLFEQGAARAIQRGALVIDMASIKPQEARDHAARLAGLGVSHLDAPLSGGTAEAEAGTLVIMAGGKAADFGRAQPVFEALGRATHVGPHGTGQLAKLASQMVVGISIGAVAEALLLCQKGGADMAKVKDAITGGGCDSRVLQVHGQRMIERDFAARNRLAVQLNAMRNALATAHEIGFAAPITTFFEQLYADGLEHGLADLDDAGLFVELASRNGMQ